ncbi:ribosomal L1 domain-containing protein CG13096 [Bicyclus anynana]|uniref:Ribosomal L1 domain-containing protein CG13096 n=1 Tax=Bicyclus anynana TaxID=110368 RepID=A0A6J1NUK5_BICAN|nr:ribosomal L1 domain-containing protein CG13096 [Bicyclus anynana]XP_023947041.2 ribosomal L1 domain-containing protein CG13096 [Bicyclus anynana]
MVSVKRPKTQVEKEHVKNEKIKKAKTSELKKTIQKSTSPSPSINKVIDKTTPTIKRMKKSHFKMPSKVITDDLVSACLVALEKLTTHYDKKNAIFGDETQIFMEIRCIKIPNTRANARFFLPHTTVSTTGEVCLVTPDLKKGRKIDHEPTVEHWEDLLRAAGVKSVKTVLPMRQLRVEYDQYELKRRLMTQHDFIMVDNRILNHVSHILGKMFFKKPNMLIPVKINEKKDLKKNIDIGLRTVTLRIAEGQTSMVVVGHTAMPPSHIKENILALVKQLKDKFPGGEQNIRSLSIKLPLSLSLPLYLTLRPANSVAAPRIKQNRPKSSVIYEDELTTEPGSIVQVAPDGTVNLKKLNTSKPSKEESELDNEEAENEDILSSDDDN